MNACKVMLWSADCTGCGLVIEAGENVVMEKQKLRGVGRGRGDSKHFWHFACWTQTDDPFAEAMFWLGHEPIDSGRTSAWRLA